MADNKIVHRISLEGAEKVAKQLQSIGLEGENAGKKVKTAFDGLSIGGSANAGKALGGVEFDHGREAAERFREVLHTLHPILGTAGLEIGNLGAFARLAGAGLAPLGAALVGSVLVGLAKVGEESEKTRSRLKALGGDDNALDGLIKQSKELGTSTANLQPSLEKYLATRRNVLAGDNHVIHPPGYVGSAADDAASRVRIFNGGDVYSGGVPPVESFQKAQSALFESSRIDKTDSGEAGNALTTFFGDLFDGGKLTSKMVDDLAKVSPAMANTLAKSLSVALGANVSNSAELEKRLDDGHTSVSGQQVIAGLEKAEPGVRTEAEAARGVSEAFEALAASSKRLAEAFSGDSLGLAKAIQGVSKAVDSITDKVDRTLHPKEFEPGGGKFIGPVRPEDEPGKAPKSLGEVFTSDKGDLLGRLTGYVREGATNNGAGTNPFGVITDFVTKALSNPAAIPGNVPEQAGTSQLIPKSLGATEIPSPLDLLRAPVQPVGPPASQPAPVLAPQGPGGPTAPPQAPLVPQQLGAAELPQSPQIVETIAGAIASMLNEVRERMVGPDNNKVTGPVDAVGIRGDATPQGEEPVQNVAALDGAAGQAAEGLRQLAAAASAAGSSVGNKSGPATVAAATGGSIVRMAEGGQARLNVSPGGHLSGPGTGTSDSIPADVANGEFVVNAKDTAKNIELLHDINSGKDVGSYAEGGEVQKPKPKAKPEAKPAAPDLKGDFSVVYDPNTGGAYINGNLHVPGDPILTVPEIAQAIARSKADADQPVKASKKHSDFVGIFGGNAGGFAEGGIVGETSGVTNVAPDVSRFAEGGSVSRESSASTFAARINAMGLSSIDIPHFAIGGMPHIPSPDLSKSDLQPAANSKGMDLLHPVTLNLPGGGSVDGVYAHPDAVSQLRRAAIDGQTFSTGKKPAWFGSGG